MSEAPLIRNKMAHTPVDTHYAAPMNTPILLVPRTFCILQQHFTCSSVCVIYSITCTNYFILYISETCRQFSARFGEHLRSIEETKHISLMMTTSALQFILTYSTTQSMTWKFLLFYTYQPKNCLEKPWRKKSSLSLEQFPNWTK